MSSTIRPRQYQFTEDDVKEEKGLIAEYRKSLDKLEAFIHSVEFHHKTNPHPPSDYSFHTKLIALYQRIYNREIDCKYGFKCMEKYSCGYRHNNEDRKIWNIDECKSIDKQYLDDEDLYNNTVACLVVLFEYSVTRDITSIITLYISYPDILTKRCQGSPMAQSCNICALPLFHQEAGKIYFCLRNGKHAFIMGNKENILYNTGLGHQLLSRKDSCDDVIHGYLSAGYYIEKCKNPSCDKYKSVFKRRCVKCGKNKVKYCVFSKVANNRDPSTFPSFFIHADCVDLSTLQEYGVFCVNEFCFDH